MLVYLATIHRSLILLQRVIIETLTSHTLSLIRTFRLVYTCLKLEEKKRFDYIDSCYLKKKTVSQGVDLLCTRNK